MNANQISVMIIDDSTIMRSYLREVINSQLDMHVVVHARNGELALPRIRYHQPQVIVLDYEMPEMDGLEALRIIKCEFPQIKVIMFSSHTVSGAQITIEALHLGATDFLPKPVYSDDQDPKQFLLDNLVPRIRGLIKGSEDIGFKTNTFLGSEDILVKPKVKKIVKQPGHDIYSLCAIGISTGGPEALRKLLHQIPGNLAGSIIITQHMPPVFTEQLAISLNRYTNLTVVEGKAGMILEPAHVYIAPGGHHMVIAKIDRTLQIMLDDSPPYHHCKPSVNIMFSSLVHIKPKETIAVIMTGMGSDGYEAIRELEAAGACILAQNETSCLVYGMPAKPVEMGLVTAELDVDGLAAKITTLMGVK